MNYWSGAASLVCLCIAVILLFACLSWLVNRRQDRLPMAYLLATVVLVVLQSLEFLYHAGNLIQRWPFFLKLVDPAVTLLPFCIYGYIRAIQGENVLARPRDRWLHATPMILVALLAIPFWSLPGEQKVYWMLQGRESEALWPLITLYGNPYLALIGGLSLFYWWLQRHQGVTSRKPAVQEWVSHLQFIQLIIAGTVAVRIAVYALLGWSFSVTYALAPTTAYLTYLLLTHAHPPIHVPRAATLPKAEPGPSAPESVETSEPDNDASRALFSHLSAAMAEGLFRDNALTLGKLAEHCNVTTHQASAAINQCSGTNFYEWVNGFRIDEACQLLTTSDASITQICYDVGFNSKSTFNTAFRKVQGCTPTQYRKQHPPATPSHS